MKTKTKRRKNTALRTGAAAPWMNGALDVAIRCQQSGLADEAKQLYIRILERDPDHPSALRNLAIIAWQSGDLELAVGLSQRALALFPECADLHASLAIVLDAAGDRKRAGAEFREALRLDPNCVDALYNFGNALKEEGLLQEAAPLYQRVLAIEPLHPHARTNLGNIYLLSGDLGSAAACFEKVIEEQPDNFGGYVNLACVLRRQGETVLAEANLRRAIQLDPNQPYPRSNLGSLLLSENRIGEAIACLEEATLMAPGNAQVQISLGAAYERQGRTEEALGCYQRALALEPNFAATHQFALFMLHYDPKLDAKALLLEHMRWAERHANPLWTPERRHANRPDPERKIRIGYVSPDLHEHPVAFFLRPVLRAHDRNQVEAVCYAEGKIDAWTERLRPHVALWRAVDGLGDAEMSQLIEQDQIDILIDLSGHTAKNRLLLFARKPAPVQASWLGYFNTTGMAAMDYLIVDPRVAPPEEQAPFAEQALRLPGCYLTYEIPDYAPAVATAPCVARGYVTYGCFNAVSKVGLPVVSAWSEVLRRNPTARLVMKTRAFGDDASRRLYQQHFERCGVSRERVDLVGPSAHQEVLPYYSEVDIALDPFPYNGGTTSCEALAMGVPVITLRGDRFVSRVGATIVESAGLPELVAGTVNEYIEKAVDLGRHPALIAEMRAGMRRRLAASTLCDTDGFTRRLEGAYRDIWRRWCDTQRAV